MVLIFFLALASRFPYYTEKFYSRGIYQIIRNIDLFFLRWLPFSLGDLLYIFFLLWVIFRFIHFQSRNKIIFIEKILWRIVWIFYFSWGLNYFRIPVSSRQSLNLMPAENKTIAIITENIIDSLNHLHLELQPDTASKVHMPRFSIMKKKAEWLYRQQAHKYPYLYMPYYVIKPSMLSYIVSYAGISGYFNPFTHEAQYNQFYPLSFRPHIILHELAHQIGYAYENEAEYIAWQTAIENGDNLFRYAAHLNALTYFLNYWYVTDKKQWKNFQKRLLPAIQNTLADVQKFQKKYYISIDLSRPYHYYLKINQKGKGQESYSELMLYIIAYYQKHHYLKK